MFFLDIDYLTGIIGNQHFQRCLGYFLCRKKSIFRFVPEIAYSHGRLCSFRIDAVYADARAFPFLCNGLNKVDNGRFCGRIDAVECSSACIGTGGKKQ